MSKSKIILPKTFTREVWSKNSNPDYEKYIGLPCISYSQINSFLGDKGFNTGLLSKYEYIRSYFMGEKYPQGPFAEYGLLVEDYICERKGGEAFSASEKERLEKVETLGVFQTEMVMDMGSFVVLGFLDDRTEDWTEITDYKNASEKSKEKFFKDSYIQLQIYSMWILKTQQILPSASVTIVERLGGGEVFSKNAGIECMSVGPNIWKHQVDTSLERLAEVEKIVIDTVQDISNLYWVFLKIESQFTKMG